MNGQLIEGKAMKTGNASYKKSEKKQEGGNNNRVPIFNLKYLTLKNIPYMVSIHIIKDF